MTNRNEKKTATVQRKKFNDKYRIETTRLRGYDYASAGWYHVVICTKDRVCHFGEVRGGVMGLSAVGCIAHRYGAAIPAHSDRAVMDAFVVMPNHVHAIVGLTSGNTSDGSGNTSDGSGNTSDGSGNTSDGSGNTSDGTVETLHATSLQTANKNRAMADISPDAGSLSAVIRSYKSAVTRWARKNGHLGFAWQPRYYDRIIRNERERRDTCQYVTDNPLQWRRDRNHPDHL